MDTISRESNSSYLPVAGVLVGVVALIFGIAALVKVSSLGKKVPDDLQDRLTSVETDARNASAAADKASKGVDSLQRSSQAAFDSIGPEIGGLKDSVKKLEDAQKAHATARQARADGATAKKGEGSSSAAAAGPDEYVVKAGDTGTKIAHETGVTLSALEAANPGIDWKKLKVGQSIKTK
jgi:LysM repeat protein